MSKITQSDLESRLAHCTGTEGYHKGFLPLRYTDGVFMMAELAGAHWLIDAIASHQSAKVDTRCDGFQVWLLTKNKNGNGAVLACYTDIDQTPKEADRVVQQRIPYTDFPLDPGNSFKLYVEGVGRERTLLLPQEH